MDIQKVNTVLTRALRFLESAERDYLIGLVAESYVGVGGTEAPDNAPDGDPATGGDGGVNNDDSAEEAFYAFLMDTVASVMANFETTEDDALGFLEDFADECAASGDMPPLPDPEIGTAEEFSTWAAAAVTFGFGTQLIQYISSQE
jgi:hypothetical protein